MISKHDKTVITQVIIIDSGGTINMNSGEGRKPADMVKHMLEKLESKGIKAELISPFDRSPDSSNMGSSEWNVLAREIVRINKKKRDAIQRTKENRMIPEIGGVVVTHGTDTMQLSSLAVSYMLLKHDICFPVVFTGAYSPPEEPGSDAWSNFEKSIVAVSGSTQEVSDSLPPNVYVLIGEDIHLASRLAKVYTTPDQNGKYFFSF